MRRRVSTAWMAVVVGAFVMIAGPGGSVSAQDSVQACVNPNSGAVKILLGGGGCTPGSVTVTLSTGAGGSGGGGPRVVDALDADVGAYLGAAGALRHVPPYWLIVPVREGGFRRAGLDAHYLSTDCTGDAYLRTEEGALTRQADLKADGLLHFAGDPIQLLTMHSTRDARPDGSLGATCFNDSSSWFFGPDTSVDPATFGLTTPFRLADQ